MNNKADSEGGTVSGGNGNTVQPGAASGSICGGRGNLGGSLDSPNGPFGRFSSVLGGMDNIASGNWATVIGGTGKTASADSSIAP